MKIKKTFIGCGLADVSFFDGSKAAAARSRCRVKNYLTYFATDPPRSS